MRQERLVPYENPLTRRLGVEFFRSIPKRPGVYVMRGAADSVLYVGKAKSLRARLATYRRATPEQVSRKVIRMIHLVEHITWEECDSEKAALLRENELLRTLRPPFNVLNTRPDTYYLIAFQISARHLQLRLTTREEIQEGFRIYGAYKGRGRVRESFSALLRLLYGVFEQKDRFDFPSPLVSYKPVHSFQLKLPELSSTERKRWQGLLDSFLSGRSRKLLVMITERLLARDDIPRFYHRMLQEDLEATQDFFASCARLNRKLRIRYELPTPRIPQTRIDDLLVAYRLDPK